MTEETIIGTRWEADDPYEIIARGIDAEVKELAKKYGLGIPPPEPSDD